MGQKKKLRGISWSKRDKIWRAQITKSPIYEGARKKHIHLGNYRDAETAARVYDVAARILQGARAQLNYDGRPPGHISRAKILQRILKAITRPEQTELIRRIVQNPHAQNVAQMLDKGGGAGHNT